jgi:hypothetical protein
LLLPDKVSGMKTKQEKVAWVKTQIKVWPSLGLYLLATLMHPDEVKDEEIELMLIATASWIAGYAACCNNTAFNATN